jgi:CheY-like chemotaxis protein
MGSRATVLSGVDASRHEVASAAATILVVGDDRNVRTSLAAYLGRHGYAVRTVSRTGGALGVLAERDVDIVLADLRTAGRGDLALLRDIRRRRPETVIVLMTAPNPPLRNRGGIPGRAPGAGSNPDAAAAHPQHASAAARDRCRGGGCRASGFPRGLRGAPAAFPSPAADPARPADDARRPAARRALHRSTSP